MSLHGDDSKDDSGPAVRFFLWRVVRLGKGLVPLDRGADSFEGSRALDICLRCCSVPNFVGTSTTEPGLAVKAASK